MSSVNVGSNMGYGTVAVGTSAGVIVAARTVRKSVAVQNNHGSQNLFVGGDSSVTTSTGFKIGPGGSMSFDEYTGVVYGIASGASTTTNYVEVY